MLIDWAADLTFENVPPAEGSVSRKRMLPPIVTGNAAIVDPLLLDDAIVQVGAVVG